MAILIENMEMPTEGYIDVRIKCNGTASFAIGKNPYFKEVEAVPVPEPHGRLGDLDALPWFLANTSVKYATYEDWEMLCDAIAAAPTVIPASEEGE